MASWSSILFPWMKLLMWLWWKWLCVWQLSSSMSWHPQAKAKSPVVSPAHHVARLELHEMTVHLTGYLCLCRWVYTWQYLCLLTVGLHEMRLKLTCYCGFCWKVPKPPDGPPPWHAAPRPLLEMYCMFPSVLFLVWSVVRLYIRQSHLRQYHQHLIHLQ